MGQEMLTLSGTTDFTPFGIVHDHPFVIYTLYITEFVSFKAMFV